MCGLDWVTCHVWCRLGIFGVGWVRCLVLIGLFCIGWVSMCGVWVVYVWCIWVHLGCICVYLGAFGVHLGAFGVHLGCIWVHLGAFGCIEHDDNDITADQDGDPQAIITSPPPQAPVRGHVGRLPLTALVLLLLLLF